MSEKEQEILTNIGKALQNMSDFNKGYLLGVAEASANKKKDQEEAEAQLVQQ